jgi:5'-nucleotidase (lipoprotein e(P4) family)
MKRVLIFQAVLLFTFLSVSAQIRSKKAVFVIVDGIPADVIEKVATPALDAIAKQGKFLHAYVGGEKGGYSETPTISAVGYNSLLTGTWANKHNVWGNDISAPNYSYPTIFRLFKNQYPGKKTAIFSSWLDNRTKLAGDELAQTGNLKIDYHFDGLELDTINYPHDDQSAYMHRIDEAVVNNAADYLKNEAPDLSWVYLEYTDDMAHRYGDSKQFYDAVQMMDDQMRRIWESIQYRQKNFKEDWVIYITTDHGRTKKDGRDHGGQSDRERSTWIVTNAKNVNPWFQSHAPGIVYIAPSIASWLNLTIPKEQLREVDGISLTGKVAAEKLNIKRDDDKLIVTWKAVDKNAKGKIWLSLTNNYYSGGKDDYKLIKELPLANEKLIIDISKMPSSFYKVALETPSHFLNRWWKDERVSALDTQGPAWGAVWQQKAAEYKALCYQAYNVAKWRLDMILQQPHDKPVAIVTDIDETVLDNSPYELHRAFMDSGYTDASWMEWTGKSDCDTVPGGFSFMKYASSKGVKIFYITNRLEAEREATLKDLQRWGFPDAVNENLFLKQKTSGKQSRRNIVAQNHEIILLFGDNLSDFSAVFDKKPFEIRNQQTINNAALFGDKFIVLPNAMYGDWEETLYKYNHALNPAQKDVIIKQQLRSY